MCKTIDESKARPDVGCTELLAALRSARHPNCTAYLIWHYLDRGDIEAAHAEYCRDSDKLGNHRKTVEMIFAANDRLHGRGRSESE